MQVSEDPQKIIKEIFEPSKTDYIRAFFTALDKHPEFVVKFSRSKMFQNFATHADKLFLILFMVVHPTTLARLGIAKRTVNMVQYATMLWNSLDEEQRKSIIGFVVDLLYYAKKKYETLCELLNVKNKLQLKKRLKEYVHILDAKLTPTVIAEAIEAEEGRIGIYQS